MYPLFSRLAALTGCLSAFCILLSCTPLAVQIEEDLDKERYQVRIVRDPDAAQGLRGFLRLGRGYSLVVKEQLGSVPNPLNLKAVVDVMNDHTDIETGFALNVSYTDPRLFELPIIVPQTSPEKGDLESLSRYLLEGGFIMGLAPESPFHPPAYIEALVKYGGLVEGQDLWIENLADDHPIYTVFFNMRGGRPLTQEVFTGNLALSLRGLFVKGRLAAVQCFLPKSDHPEDDEFNVYSTRHVQMAVNVVVYALIQEGSTTQRLMQKMY